MASSQGARIRGFDAKEHGSLLDGEDDLNDNVEKDDSAQAVLDEEDLRREAEELRRREKIPVRKSVLELLHERKSAGGYLRIAAPMVRYSKIAFREVVRMYDTDVAFTPMILSDVFKRSNIARECDFTTNDGDDPCIVQFAASEPEDLADATELVSRFVSGVDLNCGCPQKWAIAEGIGCHLMSHPELVKEMVRSVKDRLAASAFAGRLSDGSLPSCSIKIRIHSDIKETVEMVRRAEAVGVDWITVHGRTRRMKNTEAVRLDAIKTIKESAHVPIFANGSIFSLSDADRTVEETGCDGVMAARGLLQNPALFAGHGSTPLDAMKAYLKLSIGYGTTFFILHHHLMYMLEKAMSRAEKKRFNSLSSTGAVVDYMEEHYGLVWGS